MLLADIKIKAEKDLHIDASELDLKSVTLPYITGDWLKILNEEALKLKKISAEHDKLRGKKYHFYKTGYSVVLKSSAEVWEYIRADEEYNTSSLKLAGQEETVKYIEGVISSLNSMSFNISNAIKWNMFKSGGA